MNDWIQVPVELALDDDGFLRRECPTCEREFKWFSHQQGDPDAEIVTQYYCPLCGIAAAPSSWWTPEQIEYARGASGPELDRLAQDSVEKALKGMKGFTFKRNSSFTLGIETPDPLTEANDMVIVEPPCHPNEPLKVPENATQSVHCLICGELFAA